MNSFRYRSSVKYLDGKLKQQQLAFMEIVEDRHGRNATIYAS
ncbi:MAG: hypothetical protein ACK5F6_03090 [Bacteroidota bacterium]